MNDCFESPDEGEGDFVRLSQFNDLIRRPTRSMSGEPHLFWPVLEDAIRSYLWSMRRLAKKQREAFIEISDWFYGRSGFDNGLFAFRTMCKLLEIDPVRVIKRLGSVRARDLPLRRWHRVATYPRLFRRAAQCEIRGRDPQRKRDTGKVRGSITQVAIALCAIALFSSIARAEDVLLPLPAEDQKAIATRLGPNVVGDPVPSKPIGDPLMLFPFHNERIAYRFTSGKNTGKSQTVTLTRVEHPNKKVVWRMQLTPSLVAFLTQGPDGDIDMPAVEETEEGALVIVTPGNPWLPKDMKPGETKSYSQKVSVRYVDDLEDEEYSGKLKTDYTYLGAFRVSVPAGTFDAILLRTKVDGKVGPAHTRGTSYSFFAPGVGLIAAILQQKVSAFWIYNVDTAGGKVLVSR
jgi:hypothetical protein